MQTEIILNERVRQLRTEARMSQKELGEVLGLTAKSICTIEKGTQGTTIEKLVLLAEYFHVSTDYLLGITDKRAWRGKALKGKKVVVRWEAE